MSDMDTQTAKAKECERRGKKEGRQKEGERKKATERRGKKGGRQKEGERKKGKEGGRRGKSPASPGGTTGNSELMVGDFYEQPGSSTK